MMKPTPNIALKRPKRRARLSSGEISVMSLVGENRESGHRVFAGAEDGFSDRDIGNAWADLVHDDRRLDTDPRGKSHLLEIAVLSGPAFPVRVNQDAL